MGGLNLSQDEQALIHRVAGERSDAFHRIGFHLATLGPVLAFALFGLVRRDLLALALAFFSLLGLTCWRIAAEVRWFPLYRSLCQKLLAHQQAERSPGS